MSHIQANADTLLRQASMTADGYLSAAIESIDKAFEKGFAKKHPELVAAYMKVAASDFNHATLAKAQAEAIETLSDSVNNLADKLETALSSR